jgi:Cd2+/Zn2+-exporting ATPase
LIAVVPPVVLQRHLLPPWFYRALTLLVVSCPCALVISTPVSIVAAIGNAAGNGVLIKGGAYLEQAGRIKVVAFDKTGTLTRGQSGSDGHCSGLAGEKEEELLALAAAIEQRSEHPLAQCHFGPGPGGRPGTRSLWRRFLPCRARAPGPPSKDRSTSCGKPSDFFQEDLGWDVTGYTSRLVDAFQDEGKTVILLGDQGED